MYKKISLLFAAVIILSSGQAAIAQGVKPDGSVKNEQAKIRSAEARQKAEARVDEIKLKVEERKLQIKQDVCEKRQDRLQKAMPKMAKGAESVKSSIDKVYERVQGFYDKGQLTVSNYDELDAAVAAAKADAEVSMEAIEAYEFVLDCENANAGQQLDAYRSIVKDAKDSLKDYRKALVELISSMRSAAADKSNDSQAPAEETTETEGDSSNE